MRKVGNFFIPDEEKADFLIQAYENGGWQLDHLEYSLKFVENFDVAIDAGTNIGSWTQVLCDKFKTVHGFEIYPPTYECLKENLRNYSNSILHNVGLSNKEEYVNVKFDDNYPNCTGGNYISGNGNLKCITLDSLNLNKLDYYKLDIEGYEYFALQGSIETIKKCKPIIFLEFKERLFKKFNLKGKDVLNLLNSLNYKKIGNIGSDIVFKFNK